MYCLSFSLELSCCVVAVNFTDDMASELLQIVLLVKK